MASNLSSSFSANRILLYIFLLATTFVCSPTFSAAATEVTLAWDANSEPDLAGYRLYARQADQGYDYTFPECDSRETSCTINDLVDTVEYCFIVRAYDTDGNESADSNEVCLPPTSEDPNNIDDDNDGVTENQGDCNDADATINPNAAEICGDGIDQDCDGSDDLCPADIDNDGDGVTENQGDCNDADATINPNAAEICGDGIDQDCDGSDDLCPADIDNDGDGVTENQGDCNDADATINPNAAEICGDGIDQDCDGSDDLCPADIDNDGDGVTENQGDCNDADATINPNAAEICGDGIDQDCDGSDDLCPADIDNDGDGVTENQGDCNDADATINPNAAEICGDGIDQDCDGSDDLCPADINNDGDGVTENQGDCNDADATINPNAAEICGDGIDQDCDGSDLTCAKVIADAGPDQTVAEGGTVTLNGSSSHDPNGSIAFYFWTQTSGPDVNLSGADTSTPHFIAPEIVSDMTILEFSLTVENSDGLSSTDTCLVAVIRQNQPPVADAGPDQKVAINTEVTLSGSNSTSSDDTALSYSWIQISGEPVQLSDALASSPTFQAPVTEQALVFDLIVTDEKGLTNTDSCIVNVSEQNEPPSSFAGSDTVVTSNQTVRLDGSGSLDDGDVVSYYWSQTEGPTVTLSDSTSPTPEFTSPAVGPEGASLTFQLTVTDLGDLKDTDSCIVNVTSLNQPPQAVTNDYVEAASDTIVTLDGTLSTDIDDGIDNYRWHQLEGPPVIFDNPKAAQVKFSAPTAGPYGSNMLFVLKVKDKGGLKKSAKCAVFVQPKKIEDSPFTITPSISLFQKGPFYQSKASVIVEDKATGAVFKDVTVKGEWSLPGTNLDSSDIVIGSTGGNGEVKLDSERFTDKGTIKFTIIEVSKDGEPYKVNIESTLTMQ